MRRIILMTMLLMTACSASGQDEIATPGTLVIVGGGLERDTADVWTAFIDAAKDDGPFVIVPSASGSPAQSAQSVRETLIQYGMDEARIQVAPLAIRDDDTTADVDESLWAENAQDAETTSLLDSAAAIWFTGGDQSRTTEILLENGQDTPALAAIRRAHEGGTAIGGTSAGAAIMSSPMIIQGDSLTALTGSELGEQVRLSDGLGFFQYGLVDQHFGERARLGRLVAALMDRDYQAHYIGFGIDENTALIAHSNSEALVAGTGYVTIVNRAGAMGGQFDNRIIFSRDMHLSHISKDDMINLDTLEIRAADWKKPTAGNEYYETPLASGAGLAAPRETLSDVLGNALLDNKESQSVTRLSFGESGRGTRFVFEQQEASRGYWGRHPETDEAYYTIVDVGFDIRPTRLSIPMVPED